jgi:hypothetical protein
MPNLYDPTSLGITAPSGGFQQGGWYSGRQYWDGKLGDVGVVINPEQTAGYGQAVSEEVNRQSAAAQGVSYDNFANYLTQQNQKSASVTPSGTTQAYTPGGYTQAATTGTSGAVDMAPPATINLPETYKKLQQESGVSELESQYSQMEREYIDAKGKINDNPFLSEATRVGRIAKIEELFNERTANIRGEIAQKKADIETQLNLQMKQFDINSQQAQVAMDQFNSLLASGALDNASGEDIANITRATGLSSGMIQSAIQANKAKNINTSVSTWSDGVNDYFIAVDQNGNIINRQLIGRSNAGTATTGYSSDPLVNSYLEGLLQKNTTSSSDYSDIWDIVIQPTTTPSSQPATTQSSSQVNLDSYINKYGLFDRPTFR